MGRLSAAIGRLTQSLFHPAGGQTQVYIDDVALAIRGCKELHNLQLAKVLYVLSAFGVQISMSKGERGKRVTWIGTTFELQPNEVILGTPRKLVMENQETLAAWTGKGMIATKELRSFLGMGVGHRAQVAKSSQRPSRRKLRRRKGFVNAHTTNGRRSVWWP